MNNGVNFTYTKGLTTNCPFLRDILQKVWVHMVKIIRFLLKKINQLLI